MPFPVLPKPTSDQFTMTLGEPRRELGARRKCGLPPGAAVTTTTMASRQSLSGVRMTSSVGFKQGERRDHAMRLPHSGGVNPDYPGFGTSILMAANCSGA